MSDLITVRIEELISAIHAGYVHGWIEHTCEVEPTLLSGEEYEINPESKARVEAWVIAYWDLIKQKGRKKRMDGSQRIPHFFGHI